jgi:hypothetical protein
MEARVYEIKEVHVEWLVQDISLWPPIIAISVLGHVNSTGWTPRKLVPLYYVAPADGIQDFDFNATAPTGFAHFTISRIGTVLALPVPPWLKGVRVHSTANALVANLSAAKTGMPIKPAGGLPLPWPFPWLSPPEQK